MKKKIDDIQETLLSMAVDQVAETRARNDREARQKKRLKNRVSLLLLIITIITVGSFTYSSHQGVAAENQSLRATRALYNDVGQNPMCKDALLTSTYPDNKRVCPILRPI